jgi:hypothetical protein
VLRGRRGRRGNRKAALGSRGPGRDELRESRRDRRRGLVGVSVDRVNEDEIVLLDGADGSVREELRGDLLEANAHALSAVDGDGRQIGGAFSGIPYAGDQHGAVAEVGKDLVECDLAKGAVRWRLRMTVESGPGLVVVGRRYVAIWQPDVSDTEVRSAE